MLYNTPHLASPPLEGEELWVVEQPLTPPFTKGEISTDPPLCKGETEGILDA